MKKKTIIILLAQLFISAGLFAQQRITFKALANKAPIFNYDNPQNPGTILQNQPIAIELILDDTSKLTAVEFLDSKGALALSLSPVQIKRQITASIDFIIINQNRISNLPSSPKVPFPFKVKLVYNGITISSALIGGKALNTITTKTPVRSPKVDSLVSMIPQNPVPTPVIPVTSEVPTAIANPLAILNPPSVTNPADLTNGSKHTGIAFYDAIAIEALLQGSSVQPLYNYMQQFYFPEDSIHNKASLIAAVKGNTFLTGVFNTLPDDSIQKVGTSLTEGIGTAERGPTESPLAAIGGLDVTNLANGMAQFMVKRAQEELTIAFFNRFKAYADQHTEFKILFPQTTSNLANLLAYSYPNMLPALRTGFSRDLKGLSARLEVVLTVPECESLLKNFPEIKIAIRSVTLLDSVVNKKLNVDSAIISFSNFQEFNDTSYRKNTDLQNFGNSTKLLAVFSKALSYAPASGTTPANSWVGLQDLKGMIKNQPEILNIFLGLVELQVHQKNIHFYYKNDTTAHAFDKVLDGLAGAKVKTFTNVLNDFLAMANEVDATKNSIESKKATNTTLTNDDFLAYVNNTIDIIGFGFDITKNLDPNFTASKYIPIARKADTLYQNIYQEEYPQAMLNAVGLINSSISLVKVTNANKAALSKLSTVIDDIDKYGLFIANMVNAKTSDEVESLVEGAVLPVGSSSIKKNSNFNFSVQSYLGAYMSTSSAPTNINTAWTDKFGISAPIGLSVSYGLKKWGAVSVFGSVFDIGAIVDYQLKNDSVVNSAGKNTVATSKNYQIKLGQIVSPGAYLVYGIGGNIPLSLGFGYQYGPGLGKINSDNTTVVNNPSGRWSIFLSVDIPLINLVNKTKPANSK